MKKKYKIALVTYSLSNGGLERVVANYSELFSDLGHEVHLFVIDSMVNYEFSGTLHQYNIGESKGFQKIKKYFELKKLIKSLEFDLILDHRFRKNPISEFFWQHYIYYNQKVINFIHSSKLENYLTTLNEINRYIFKNNLFVCVSKGIEEKMNEKFPYFRTKTIYNPIKILNKKAEIDVLKPYILAVGRMEKTNVKQFDVLLKCFTESTLPKKNFQLVILGDGETKQEMESLSKKLNIRDKTIFKGFVGNPYPYFENAYLTVLTSKYEGFGLVLAESLMCGTPVISFDCDCGPREIIQNRINGLLVENQNNTAFINALDELVENSILYDEIKANAKKFVEKFSFDCIKKEWETFLDEINDKH